MAIPNRPTSGAPVETAWGDVVHDTIVANDLQYGKQAANASPAAAVAFVDIVFPRPFASPPAVICTGEFGSSQVVPGSPSNITASGCRVNISKRDGTNISGGWAAGWIAVGPRA